MRLLKCIGKLFNKRKLNFAFFFYFYPFTFHFEVRFLFCLNDFIENNLRTRRKSKLFDLDYLIKITAVTFALCECVIWQNYNNIMEAITLVKDNWAKNLGSWTLLGYIFNVHAATSFFKLTSFVKKEEKNTTKQIFHTFNELCSIFTYFSVVRRWKFAFLLRHKNTPWGASTCLKKQTKSNFHTVRGIFMWKIFEAKILCLKELFVASGFFFVFHGEKLLNFFRMASLYHELRKSNVED